VDNDVSENWGNYSHISTSLTRSVRSIRYLASSASSEVAQNLSSARMCSHRRQIHVATVGKFLPTNSASKPVSKPYAACAKVKLEAIAKDHPAARIDELMPWNFNKES
jgi:hypothetical protein